mgnify:CR=1 FL=1
MDAGGLAPTLSVVGRVEAALPDTARALGWHVVAADDDSIDHDRSVAAAIVGDATRAQAARQMFPGAVVIGLGPRVPADVTLPAGFPRETGVRLLRHCESHWRYARRLDDVEKALDLRTRQSRQLSEIGIALSSQLEFKDLLATILTEARRIADCEAGSLYLIESRESGKALVFKLAQNDVVAVPLANKGMPVSPDSLAGYVAATGETLLSLIHI